MDNVKSRQALLRFIDWTGEKGLMQADTVRGRKATASQMLGILDDAEAADVTLLDVDHLADRFSRLNPHKYTPASVAAYKGRPPPTHPHTAAPPCARGRQSRAFPRRPIRSSGRE